jgi:transcriptional regulator with GAF, ATPase, and Fis domain
VLILGESGTGKELVAREIHQRSRRKDKPLVRVNCASIPKDLFESEFFGHARGAFTGAVKDRAGRFEAADGGTLFLDEIGEVPLDLQGKLLRVLQEKYYERVGEDRTRQADVRVIAATNRNFQRQVEAGHFREDLFYRLNVFPIQVPSLRERTEDVPPLAKHFIETSVRELGCPKPRLTRAAIAKLEIIIGPATSTNCATSSNAPSSFPAAARWTSICRRPKPRMFHYDMPRTQRSMRIWNFLPKPNCNAANVRT